jgi:acetyl esterase/lipase/lysophospholipase L1-like esterase
VSRFVLAALGAASIALAAPRPPIDVYLIGDSTMAAKADPDMNPEVGWGMRLPRFFTSDVRIHNQAVNGRSTKSFIDQGRWDSVTATLKRGDYVFIEFGHNDEKKDDTSRFADAHGAYQRNLERFVADARAKGATPILLTPIVRRKFDARGALEQTHGDYPDVVRDVARQSHVMLIDLERETRALVAPLGPERSKRLYDYVDSGMSIMYPHGHTDDTHLSMSGATEVAALVARAVRGSGLPLAQFARVQPDTTPDPIAEALWTGVAPEAVGDSLVDRPTITPFLVHAGEPSSAMIVFPGGGYEHLATDKEGFQVARWLNTLGINAFVIRYRLGPRYHHPAMLDDAEQAIRVVRRRAAEWSVDPHRVGVIGFSAGGHLAATLETHVDSGTRPDIALLIYPVITMAQPLAHAGSRRNLLGAQPSDSLVRALSAELQVTSSTPRTFIVASTDDHTVPVQNSTMMYDALRAAGVPVELHVFESARHGFGLGQADPAVAIWTTLAAAWLKRQGF